ncbi:hypothetical protein D3C85_1604990 [compost metagenome]
MNCGNNTEQNSNALGLSRLVSRPRRIASPQRGFSSVAPEPFRLGNIVVRRHWIAIHSRYAAPTRRTRSKVQGAALNNAANPNAASTT